MPRYAECRPTRTWHLLSEEGFGPQKHTELTTPFASIPRVASCPSCSVLSRTPPSGGTTSVRPSGGLAT